MDFSFPKASNKKTSTLESVGCSSIAWYVLLPKKKCLLKPLCTLFLHKMHADLHTAGYFSSYKSMFFP